MIPRTLLSTARIDGGGEMKLYSRGADHMILVEREELMSSRMSGSEEALAVMTLARLGHSATGPGTPDPGTPGEVGAPQLLIGGYGMGFTLRAALAAMPRDGRVTVIELVPEILDWARGPMAAMTGTSLSDHRVTIRVGDVADAIAEGAGRYDAILLDVDNGPDGLVRAANDRLYSPAGLALARAALRRGGVLVIWSAGADAGFTRRLREAGFTVDEQVVRARDNRANGRGRGPRHLIWFASR